MTKPELSQNPLMVPSLYILNRLTLKATSAKTREELIFLIVNDTHHLSPYNRALLFDYEGKRPKVVGISGQPSVNENAPLIKLLEKLVSGLKDPHDAKVLTPESFLPEQAPEWLEYQKQTPSSVLWVPIFSKKGQILGLWLEQLGSANFAIPIQEMPLLFKDFLMPAYALNWQRLSTRYSPRNWFGLGKKKALLFLLPALLLISLLPVSLRVAAPCEIIASNPYYVRAPLTGVIKEILVLPGQFVKKESPLFNYNSEILLHALQSAKEDVQQKQEEFDRAAFLGLQNKQSLNDLNLLQIKLEKEKINLALADYEASLLTVKAPQEGIIMIDSPDDWRGRPVTLGEKIMVISNPETTRIKIWIPESDNVPLDISKTVKIYLNIFPSESYLAKVEYVANEVTLSDREVPSYVAKADWSDAPPKDLKLGLKGTAILYGESVPLFYYIIRKPLFTVRNFFKI